MRIEQKIADMGMEMPAATTPTANFVRTARTGNLLFVAGHLPHRLDGNVLNPGKVGREVTVEQGYEAAKLAAINCLASIKEAVGDLDKVRRVQATGDGQRRAGVRPAFPGGKRSVGLIGGALRRPGTACPLRRGYGQSAKE